MVWSDGSKGWLKDVMEHELTHEMQFSVLIDGFWKSARILKTFVYPSWMMEGMAEYETGLNDYAVEKMYVRDAVLSGGLIPLSRLTQFGHLKPHQVTLGYKTGAQAIRFLAEQYGADKPRRMLELFRNRYDAGSVFIQLIGADLPEFEKKFSEYLDFKSLAEAREKIEELKILARVAKELKVFNNFNSFECLVKMIVEIAGQNEGWLRSQNPRPHQVDRERAYIHGAPQPPRA